MKRVTAWIDKALAGLLVILMTTMVITVTWQVATRYLLNSPSSVTEELASYLLIWISLLGAAYALHRKAHLGVELLERHLEGTSRIIHGYVVYATVILFALLVLVYGGGRLVLITLELDQSSAALQIPMGYVYLVLPLSGLLMAYYAMIALRELLKEEETTTASEINSMDQ